MDFYLLLKCALDNKASDLHLSVGAIPMMRVYGKLLHIKGSILLSDAMIHEMLKEILPYSMLEKLQSLKELDCAITLDNLVRLRLHIFNQYRGLSLAVRILRNSIPTISELGLSNVFYKLCDIKNGLILLTGPTGCGKSSSLAAVLNYINNNKMAHIVTIEDPIEYIHVSKQCLVHQRELSNHTASFQIALNSLLREDPDYVFIGELRNLEAIRLALNIAETGHLVFATLHTSSAIEAIDRMIDIFPSSEKTLIRIILSNVLKAVVAQRLVERKDGEGLQVLQEILLCNNAVRNLIRTNKVMQIYSIMQTGQKKGMQTFEQHFRKLVELGKVVNC